MGSIPLHSPQAYISDIGGDGLIMSNVLLVHATIQVPPSEMTFHPSRAKCRGWFSSAPINLMEVYQTSGVINTEL